MGLLQSQPEAASLAGILAIMLRNGYKQSSLAAVINAYADNSNVSDDYEDKLDELVSAMEGDCSKNYILHPVNFK